MAKCSPKIVFLDLDGTVWSSHDISSQTPPFKRIGSFEIIDSEGLVVRLKPGVIEFLKWAKNVGLKVYSLSWNIPEIACEALEAFGIHELFDGHCIEFHPHKGKMMREAIEKCRLNVKPCEIVYVDDRRIHLDEIFREVGKIIFIQMNIDVKDFYDLKRILERMLREHDV